MTWPTVGVERPDARGIGAVARRSPVLWLRRSGW
jgi:hypothetical protein